MSITETLYTIVGRGSLATASYLEELAKSNMLQKFWEPIYDLTLAEHSPDYHPEGKTVFLHVLAALRVKDFKNTDVINGIIFHDIGKPASKEFVDGRWKYKKHSKLGLDVFDAIPNYFSEGECQIIKHCIRYHMNIVDLNEMSYKKIIKMMPCKYYWEVLKEVMYADSACRGFPLFNEDEFAATITRTEKMVGEFREYLFEKEKISKLIDGRKIINLIPNISGKDIGKVKMFVIDQINKKDYNITDEEINELILTYEMWL